jgi:hypothetical protein
MKGTRSHRIFRFLLFSGLFVIGLILLVSAALSLFYEEAAIRYMKNYLGEHLVTELSMSDDVHFSLLKGFPNVTLEVNDVVLLSGKNFSRKDFPGHYSDTLLEAKSVMLQLNLIKLLRKEYELKKIEINQGHLNILFDKKNRHNLDIWKSSSGADTQNYTLHLSSVVLSSTVVKVNALSNHFQANVFSGRTNFKGTLFGEVLSGKAKGNLMLRNLTVHEKKLVSNASLQVDLDLMYSGNYFRIRQGKVQLNKALAHVSGEYRGGRKSYINLDLTIPKFGLDEVMSLIPPEETHLVRNLSFSGNGKLSLMIQGSPEDTRHLIIKSLFELTNCTARNTRSLKSIKDINLKGSVSGTNAENFLLRLERLSAKMGKGSLEGNFMLRNLKTQMFQASLRASLDLENLTDFIRLDTVEQLDGMLYADFTSSGSLTTLSSDTSANVLDLIRSGTFIFKEAGIKIKGLPLNLGQVTGKVKWDGAMTTDSLALQLNETHLLISGNVQNLSGYLRKQQMLKSNLQINTDNLDISKYLNEPSGKSSSHTGYKSISLFPDRMYLKAYVQARNFEAGKFKATDLKLNLSSLKDSLYVDHFSLNFPDGSIEGDAFISHDVRNTFSITCNAKPQNINIQQLFTAFNNFTQSFILDRNLRGRLSGTVSFYAQWDSTLSFISRSMKAQGDFTVANGELVDFEPMQKLSKYIDVDELRHIRFKTLKNTIYISDRTVTIPEMAINSSAFDILVSGSHTFDNAFDYRMKVQLSQVLFNKARKKKKEMDEFLVEENPGDQIMIPLIIAGTPDNFEVRFDKKRAFGLSKDKKTPAPPETKKPDQKNFRIEWDEPQEKTQENKITEPKKQSDFVIEWDEEDTGDK